MFKKNLRETYFLETPNRKLRDDSTKHFQQYDYFHAN